MRSMRCALIGLLALLQVLAPWLHSHAAAHQVVGWHLDFAAGTPASPLASVAPGAPAGAGLRAADPQWANGREGASSSTPAARGAAPAAVGANALAAPAHARPGESSAAEMPVEWLRDPSLALAPGCAACVARLSPAPMTSWLRIGAGAARAGLHPRFAVLAYAAAAPPPSPLIST